MYNKCIARIIMSSHMVAISAIAVHSMRDKRQKFIQLAEARVARALNDIRLIGNLSNRSAYEYADDDVRKIFRALQKELEAAKSRFGEAGSREIEFRLGD